MITGSIECNSCRLDVLRRHDSRLEKGISGSKGIMQVTGQEWFRYMATARDKIRQTIDLSRSYSKVDVNRLIVLKVVYECCTK